MSKPTTFSFGKFLLMLGDGNSPEVFGQPCGLTAKAFNQTNTTVESIVPDCDDPDAPADVERGITSKSRDISGSAILNAESFPTWQAFYDADASQNVRIYPMGPTGGYYAGKFVLATFNIAAPAIGQKSTGDITLQSDGPVVWTPGS